MEISLIILSICLLICVVIIFSLSIKNDSLRSKNKTLVKSDKINNSASIGDKCLYRSFGLISNNEVKFSVDYELEILEISNDSFKVRALNFNHNCSVGADKSEKTGIIDFMKNRWVLRRDVSIVIDDIRKKRIDILNKLGID